MKDLTLATEMLQELKSNLKRWYRIAIIELIIIISIVTMFVIYINTPYEETEETITYTQDADTEGEQSPITQNMGVE